MITYSNTLFGKTCVAYIGTNTLAMKAQSSLNSAAILSGVVKVNSSKTRRGCAYGVKFDCSQKANVKAILARDGITVKEFL